MSKWSDFWSDVGAGWNGLVKPWLNESKLGQWLSNAGSSIVNKATGAGLTGAEREANQFNAEQAQIARDWQAEMYERYNSPSAMMAQYQDAGLNPALMYGNAASMPMANSNTSPAGSVAPGSSDIIGSIASLVQLRSELDLKKAQARNLNASASLDEIRGQYEDEKIKTQIEKDKNLGYEAAQHAMAMEIDNQYKDAMNWWSIENAKADNWNKSAQNDKIYAEVEKIVDERSEIRARTEKLGAELAEINEHIVLMQSQRQLNEAQVKEVAEKINEIKAQTEVLSKEAGLKQEDLNNYLWNHAHSVTTRYGMGTQTQEFVTYGNIGVHGIGPSTIQNGIEYGAKRLARFFKK